ncbi:MAG: hypothetical protein LBB41_04570 [Prevotellaceae bacterium]|nr:hypothetical protein [Prevotellaceae bacterium]
MVIYRHFSACLSVLFTSSFDKKKADFLSAYEVVRITVARIISPYVTTYDHYYSVG